MKVRYLRRTTRRIALCVTLYFIGAISLLAQSSNGNAVVTRSWKQGTATLTKKKLLLSFPEHNEEYELGITGRSSSRSFVLRIKKIFTRTIRRPSIQCWSVVLQERLKHPTVEGYTLEGNLLSIEGSGDGDNLPTFANFFCPIENPQKPFDGGQYPIGLSRKFFIEGSILEIKVKEYSFNEETNRLGKTDFWLEIRNIH